MTKYSQEFKVQSVKKALSRNQDQTLKELSEQLGVGYSTLQTWIRLARNNKLESQEKVMTQEKSPGNWNKSERLEALMQSYSLNEEQVSSYCRERGLYPHHLEEWKKEFLSGNQEIESVSRLEQKKLRLDNKRLQKDLNRKEKALAETAALLVLSKKCQAIWGEKEVD